MALTIGETLVLLALADTALTAVIGNRFLPETIGTSARPSIAYQRISDPRDTLLKTGTSGLGRARYQFSIFAKSAAQRDQLKKLLRACIEGYSDRNNGGIIDRVVYLSSEETYDGLTKDFIAFSDYQVWHIES